MYIKKAFEETKWKLVECRTLTHESARVYAL